MNKSKMKETMLAKLEELSVKRQAVREHIELMSQKEADGRNKIVQLHEQIESHKVDSEKPTDVDTIKAHLEAIDSLNKDVEIHSLLNGKESKALETMLLPLVEETLAVHKEAKEMFIQLDKLYLTEMNISTMEEDVATINSIVREINSALSHMGNVMKKFKFIPHTSTSYRFAHNNVSYHFGQMDLDSRCKHLKRELEEVKKANNI
ncbi:hypothetical protein NYE57_07320 [Bacillus sp. FSL L8-0222]|uniref:hypothetical protein n=1 Tax=Bacillus TaxID=1386 RepID=UPI002DBD3ED4|nr:hypothetical protein [Bacillus mojavensis]MEC1620115.1 hypothetical protein [Bacillus mojavensis]MEC1658593.1 hypothetical protein [Bacillus mojavensis]